MNIQFVRFAAVGLINTAIDIVLFAVLYSLLDSPLLVANTVSTATALLAGFVLHTSYTFRDAQRTKRTFAAFLTVTLLGLWVLQPVVISLVAPLLENNFVYDFEHDPAVLVAKFCSIAVTLLWNFVWYSRVIFRK